MPETVTCSVCQRRVPERTAVEEEWCFDSVFHDEPTCARCMDTELKAPLVEIVRRLVGV